MVLDRCSSGSSGGIGKGSGTAAKLQGSRLTVLSYNLTKMLQGFRPLERGNSRKCSVRAWQAQAGRCQNESCYHG